MFESGKENMDNNKKVIPLCWDDQVQTSGAKVLTPRGPTKEKRTIVSQLFWLNCVLWLFLYITKK